MRFLRSHAKALAWISLCVLGVLALAAMAVAWYYSNAFEDEALAPAHNPATLDLRVRSIGNGLITLDTTSQTNESGLWRVQGTFGVLWPGGYGQVGEIEEADAKHSIRSFKLLKGTLSPGDAVRLDTFALPDDPMQGLGLAFTEVPIDGPLGAMPAWFVPAPGGDWAIMVHGHRSDRRDMLRALQSIHDAGLNALIVTYRNDEGAPASPDHHLRFGETEWEDVQAAAEYAIEHGAKHLVLVGNSMGGGIVMNFLYHSSAASQVEGVILDSPVLDFYETVRWRARDRAPSPIVAFGLWASRIRFGLDWDETNYLARAERLRAPMLVFHGTGDDSVPVATSERLARQRPDIVTLISLPGVGHVRSWNADPAAYNAKVAAFLQQVSPLGD